MSSLDRFTNNLYDLNSCRVTLHKYLSPWFVDDSLTLTLQTKNHKEHQSFSNINALLKAIFIIYDTYDA